MVRVLSCLCALGCAGMAQAQPLVRPPIATGSPSNANATVSPATVADAITRADDASGTNTSRLGVSIGSAIAGGSFGTGQKSRMISTALGVRAAVGTLRLSASLPYLNIRGRGLIFSGIDSTPIIASGGKPGPRITNKGLGDLTVGAAYTLPTSSGGPEVELSGRLKLPTATRASQLSTGKTDFSVGAQVTQAVGRLAPFVSGTYRSFGDPASIDLNNGIALSGGTAVLLGKRTVALLSYHYAEKASRLIKDSHELFAGASTKIGESSVRLTGFVTAGVSSGAAATSGGASLALHF